MKRTLVAPIVVALALSLSPGVAYASSNGNSGSSGSSSGSNGANGTSNANCVAKVPIYFAFFGWVGTITQCQQH